MLDLNAILGLTHQVTDWDRDFGVWVKERTSNDTSFVAAWAVQSRISGVLLLAMVALASFWVAFGIMLVWSLIATFVYAHARERGAPDLLELASGECKNTRSRAVRVGLSLFTIWLVGLPALGFTRLMRRINTLTPDSRDERMLRTGALAFGLTFFGVTVAHHILRKAGYERGELLRLTCVGSVLNVGYRVLASAAVIGALSRLASLPSFA